MKKNLARSLAMAVGLGLVAASSGVAAATECNGPLSGTVTGGVVVNELAMIFPSRQYVEDGPISFRR